jgi:hypothetical protein
MTVGRLEAEMDCAEYQRWQAFDEVEPIGDRRGDIQAAIVASLIANVHRDRKRQPKAYTLEDFMPFMPKAPEPQWSDDDLGRYMDLVMTKQAA